MPACAGKGSFLVSSTAKGWGLQAAKPLARQAELCKPLLALPGHPQVQWICPSPARLLLLVTH